MKKLLLIILSYALGLTIYSQEIKVKEFKRINGEASAQFPKDNNDVPAALVKVYLEGDVRITGSVIGEIKKINSSYHVYLANGSKRITVVKKGLLPITCVFNDFGINHVQSGNTYQLTLKEETASNEVSGSINGHDYVDLGLSVMWATCNVGANNIEDIGDFYRWAETEVYDENRPYKYYEYDEEGTIIKCTYENTEKMMEKDDVARIKWKGSWRMPSMKEWEELEQNCKEVPVVRNGVRGIIFIAENGNKLFLPYAYRHNGYEGYYWTTDEYTIQYEAADYEFTTGQSFTRILPRIAEWSEDQLVYWEGSDITGDTPMFIRPVSTEPQSKDRNSWHNYYSLKDDGICNGYGYVDLGLSVLWATCNLGATLPYEYGEKNIQHKDADQEDYIVKRKMGNYWNTPKEEEVEELESFCSWKWTDNYMGSGVSGYFVISEVPGFTNKYIFLPLRYPQYKEYYSGDYIRPVLRRQ